jgi:hypothetical protein
MAIVNPSIRGGVGSLLREAEEKDQQNQLVQKPSALPTSPFRQLVRTTMLSPVTAGSSRIVGIQPEPNVQAPVQPAQGINTIGGQNYAPRAPEPLAAGVGNPAVMGGGGGVPGVGQPASVAINSMSTSPQVRGASVNNPTNMVSPSRMGAPVAPNVPVANIETPGGRGSFASEAAFQKAQTPTQNILGGIGKVGTAVTSALKLPQLLPGGAFQKLQDKMAPTIRKILPNFNWNKG